jgi:hypothetical protein
MSCCDIGRSRYCAFPSRTHKSVRNVASLELWVRSLLLGWVKPWDGMPGEGAGLIGAVVGAIIVLLIGGAVMRQRRQAESNSDPHSYAFGSIALAKSYIRICGAPFSAPLSRAGK